MFVTTALLTTYTRLKSYKRCFTPPKGFATNPALMWTTGTQTSLACSKNPSFSKASLKELSTTY